MISQTQTMKWFVQYRTKPRTIKYFKAICSTCYQIVSWWYSRRSDVHHTSSEGKTSEKYLVEVESLSMGSLCCLWRTRITLGEGARNGIDARVDPLRGPKPSMRDILNCCESTRHV
jgi:hypothetical protein